MYEYKFLEGGKNNEKIQNIFWVGSAPHSLCILNSCKDFKGSNMHEYNFLKGGKNYENVQNFFGVGSAPDSLCN